MKLRLALLTWFLLTSVRAAPSGDKPIRVDFINTLVDPVLEPVSSLFDLDLVKTSQAAARQLGIDLRVVPAFRPETMVEETLRATRGPDRPDYLIVTV